MKNKQRRRAKTVQRIGLVSAYVRGLHRKFPSNGQATEYLKTCAYARKGKQAP